MLSKQDIAHFIAQPESLQNCNIEAFYELVQRYPYFHTAHLLLQKVLHLKEDPGYLSQLRTSSLKVNSREKLYYLIHDWDKPDMQEEKDETLNLSTPAVQVEEIQKIEPQEPLIEELILQKTPTYTLKKEEEATNHTEEKSFEQWLKQLKQNKKINQDEVKQAKFTHQALIDRFIEQSPSISPLSQYKISEKEAVPMKEEVKKEPEFVTEVLAKIYVKQHKYNKAINIYKKLCLKYPEKSVYFAGQIKKAKELLSSKD